MSNVECQMLNVKVAIEREQNEVYFDFAECEQARGAVSTLTMNLTTYYLIKLPFHHIITSSREVY